MAPQSMTVRFNPTAVAMQYNGSNWAEIIEMLPVNREAMPTPKEIGKWVVVFMGVVTVMDDDQMRAAQGLS